MLMYISISSSNLLYPKEDKTNSRLMFTCRTCHVSEPATSHCVFQNRLNSQVGDTAGVTTDVGSDPTVGAPVFCTVCGGEIICVVCDKVLLCTEEESLESLGLGDLMDHDYDNYDDDYLVDDEIVDAVDDAVDDEEETSENNSKNTKSS